MKTTIKATNVTLTDNINDYVEKRLAAIEKLVSGDDTSALCAIEVEKTTEHHKSGQIFRAEFNLHISGGDFRAESSKETLFDAIDSAKDEIVRELRRHKNKKIKNVRRGGAKLKGRIHGEK